MTVYVIITAVSREDGWKRGLIQDPASLSKNSMVQRQSPPWLQTQYARRRGQVLSAGYRDRFADQRAEGGKCG